MPVANDAEGVEILWHNRHPVSMRRKEVCVLKKLYDPVFCGFLEAGECGGGPANIDPVV